MVASSIFSAAGELPMLSRITMAFLKDTGWYEPVWSTAGHLAWGKGAGCGFVTSSCKQYMAANPGEHGTTGFLRGIPCY